MPQRKSPSGRVNRSILETFDTVDDVRELRNKPDCVRVRGLGFYVLTENVWDPDNDPSPDNGTSTLVVNNDESGDAYVSENVTTLNGSFVNRLVMPSDDVAISGGIADVLGGSLPPHVYGRDAARLLRELRSASGKSLFVFGDSRTSTPAEWMVNRWSHVPIGGLQISMNTGMNASIYSQAVLSQQPNTYQAGPGTYWTATGTCLQAVTQMEETVWWNRTSYGSLSPNIIPSTLGWPTNDIIVSQEMATGPSGTVAASLRLLAQIDNNVYSTTGVARSAYFNTYSATAGSKTVSMVVGAPMVWVSPYFAINLLFSPTIPTVVGEKYVQMDYPWVEYRDGSRTTIHSLAIGGDKIGDDLDNGINEVGYNLGPSQFPEARLTTHIRARATRKAWFLIDLGTNGTIPYVYPEVHAARLRRLIAKLRRCAGDPTAPVILRTAYPGSGDGATRYNQIAAIDVARTDPNVVCFDTYGASLAGGGYAAATAKGWFGEVPDGVHRDSNGRYALEAMFDCMVSGEPLVYSNTLG